ncbi:MAG TPA: SDR family oxidoreductase [Candidatus Eremiobacteraceae bacterium]|nr:SDR family oxidoreductase [Candidatus Eremiobacteraceae bacterium]
MIGEGIHRGFGLEGRVALVMGSTAGIGFRIAEELARAGVKVALNGRNEARGKAALARLRGTTSEPIFEAGDSTRYDETGCVVANVVHRLGRIDILVTSGGALQPPPALFHELSPEDFSRVFATQYLARVYPIHAALPYMRDQQHGNIVLVGTDAARHVTPGESLHGGIGAAIVLLTKALAREFSRWHIRVNGLALTLTSDTPTYEEIFAHAGFVRDLFTKALNRFPWGAPPTAEEVARVALFLASDQSAQVTGQTISVNGGLYFGGW